MLEPSLPVASSPEDDDSSKATTDQQTITPKKFS
jgi:hypothetical protein